MLASEATWESVETEWKRLLEETNCNLRAANRKPISRYHAADCSSRRGDFEGWSKSEQECLINRMLDIFRRQPLVNTVGFTLSPDELAQELPWTASEPLKHAYRLTLRCLMLGIGHVLSGAEEGESLRVALIHDRCSYDGELLDSFNRMLADSTFRYARYFSTLVPIKWEECIPLQAADLLAYEHFKDSQRRVTDRARRYTLKQLLEMGCFSGMSKGFDRTGLKSLAKAHHRAVGKRSIAGYGGHGVSISKNRKRFDHSGSTFDSFLDEEGSREEVEAVAIKRVLAWQVGQAMKRQHKTKQAMAKQRRTSRSQLDRSNLQ